MLVYHPLLSFPCLCSHKSTLLNSFSILLQIWPMNPSFLIHSKSTITGLRWSSIFVFSVVFHDTSSVAWIIPVTFSQAYLSLLNSSFQHWKVTCFPPWFERNIFSDYFRKSTSILFSAPQRCTILIFMSFSFDWIYDLRYLKLFSCFSLLLLQECWYGWVNIQSPLFWIVNFYWILEILSYKQFWRTMWIQVKISNTKNWIQNKRQCMYLQNDLYLTK